ncbi:Do family serine endopeptidase [Sphingobacterium sp. DK4209]|uniref:Do family serine endopeptidase n=1 Tax=Sphingobacterium zhuxiongii TaxID=2662364 RepID=A0A5Q0Q7B0_9SPHI|nr:MULTISPECIES: Do family serine endopeptidase [unclassified Sphingobacterium]MVZ66369.1 Do family serine endopeptidase [Sphingobacterium sp. DK4209]QGA25144.1 Do family serine endopeptidase [Sphingobacterium sp. dk4302]
MKKIGATLLTAIVGGAIAVGGYKLFENKQMDNMTFEERQKVYYANNPGDEALMSSTGNPDFTQAAAAVTPGVVHINVTMSGRGSREGSSEGMPFDMFEEFFGVPQQRRGQARPQTASGSGVIISPDGYIVTNNHVVEDADKIEVVLTDKKTYEAKVIGRDANFDLALIKVNANNLPIVKLGNSDNVQIGEWVLAVGYPLGLQSTVTAGIISAKGRQIGILGESQQQQQRGYGYGQQEQVINTAVESFLQTDAVINKGNSGGALVNARGELIGINSAIASPTGTYAGYGFAIPINLAKKILDDFKEFGSVKRGYVGVTFAEINDALRKEVGITDVNGLYVRDVVKGGAAEAAGIKAGDVLTKIEGRTIYGSPDLQEHVARLRPGDKVKLTYKRAGKEKEVVITLKGEESKAKTDAGDESSASATEIFNKLGASFVPATDARKKELGISSGVIVSQVHRGGVFDYFGVERGLVITKINGKPVNSVDEVESALSGTRRNIVRVTGVPEKGSTVEFNVPLKY